MISQTPSEVNRRVTFHESGHAVVCHVLGFRFNTVTVRPNGMSSVDATVPTEESTPETRAFYAVCLMAGHAAEQILCPELYSVVEAELAWGIHSDYGQLGITEPLPPNFHRFAKANGIFCSGFSRAWQDLAEKLARRLVYKYHRAILVLAIELLQQLRSTESVEMPGAQADAVIEAAGALWEAEIPGNSE